MSVVKSEKSSVKKSKEKMICQWSKARIHLSKNQRWKMICRWSKREKSPVKESKFISNRDTKADTIVSVQRSELCQCLQQKDQRRLEAQEDIRKVLDGSVEELNAFMKLDPVIVDKEDMMVPDDSSTLHLMVK